MDNVAAVARLARRAVRLVQRIARGLAVFAGRPLTRRHLPYV